MHLAAMASAGMKEQLLRVCLCNCVACCVSHTTSLGFQRPLFIVVAGIHAPVRSLTVHFEC